jgi:hypothetical protein
MDACGTPVQSPAAGTGLSELIEQVSPDVTGTVGMFSGTWELVNGIEIAGRAMTGPPDTSGPGTTEPGAPVLAIPVDMPNGGSAYCPFCASAAITASHPVGGDRARDWNRDPAAAIITRWKYRIPT